MVPLPLGKGGLEGVFYGIEQNARRWRMPYIKETYTCDGYVEIRKYYSSRYGQKYAKRGPYRDPTKEEMERINERNAITQLRRLIETNFTYGDFHVVLTYRKADRPNAQEAIKRRDKFLRKLRAAYKAFGGELKYISVVEKEARSIHHHLIINACDPAIIQKAWEWGRPHITQLDEEGRYEDLAAYLIKETRRTFRSKERIQGKRWTASRNLKQPDVKKEVVKADSWREKPNVPKGFILDADSVRTGIHGVTGYAYQEYRLLRVRKRE